MESLSTEKTRKDVLLFFVLNPFLRPRFSPSPTPPHVTPLQRVGPNEVIFIFNANKLNLFIYLIETKSV